jgi:hypothetical protein
MNVSFSPRKISRQLAIDVVLRACVHGPTVFIARNQAIDKDFERAKLRRAKGALLRR